MGGPESTTEIYNAAGGPTTTVRSSAPPPKPLDPTDSHLFNEFGTVRGARRASPRGE